ncbi:MAG TPA: LPS assembly lipoprotein LptE [Stellaceae bacterium]|nr:LPS assembly lipoprotein LptE [Stellaceae bacterium]
MWCRERICCAAAALALLALAGCGFHPLYAERTPQGYDPALAAIAVRPVADRIGQILVLSLREQLNPNGANETPRYVLTVILTVTRSDLGIRRDNTSSRGELALNASLRLTPTGGEKVLFEDSLHTVTAFNLPDDAYAATVAEQSAREAAASDLGREIGVRLAVYMRGQRARGGT